ncbi:nitroreductase [Chloroflexota bacterium]
MTIKILQGIAARRSYRAFEPSPIPKEILQRILEVAVRSPSYTNTQPWEVVVVSGSKKDELSKILYKMAGMDVPTNPDIPTPKSWPPELERRAREHGARRFSFLGIERETEQQRKGLRLSNFEFYGAPCVFFLFMERALTSWSIFDMGLFAQSIILAAHSLGLGSCLQGSIAGYPDAVREFLGISNTKLLVLGISIGYPDLKAPINTYQSSRATLKDLVNWYE